MGTETTTNLGLIMPDADEPAFNYPVQHTTNMEILDTIVVAPLSPASANDGTTLSFSSTSFLVGSPVVGFTFVAGPSGKVWASIGGLIQAPNNTFGTYLCFVLRAGASIGSGTVIAAASNATCLYAGDGVVTDGPAWASGTRRKLITGLTPGNTFNIRAEHRTTGGAAGNRVFERELSIEHVIEVPA